MTKIPATREEYQALSPEEQAQLQAMAQEVLIHVNVFVQNLVAHVNEIRTIFAEWYATLPPNVREELERMADEDNDDNSSRA